MSRRVAAQLIFLMTLACSLLLALGAQAALVPTCDAAELASRFSPPEEPSCTVVTRVVDEATGATTAAPICDPRGASAIAPQRILPVEDARIDASPSCGADALAPVTGSNARSAPYAAPAALADQALPSADSVIPPATLSATLEYLEPVHRPLCGVRRAVEHPPR